MRTILRQQEESQRMRELYLEMSAVRSEIRALREDRLGESSDERRRILFDAANQAECRWDQLFLEFEAMYAQCKARIPFRGAAQLDEEETAKTAH